MTPAQRRTYSRKYQSMQKAIEEKYVKRVHRALKKAVTEPNLINEHIGEVIRRLYLDAGLMGARKIRSELRLVKEKRASFGTNDELVDAIIAYLQEFLLVKSVIPISNTTRDWVFRELEKGQREGLGANEITRNLAGSEYLKFQALRVVRTETVRAANVGAMKAMEASPYEVQKEWIAAHDNRTRHSHMRLDGQIREFDEDFLPELAQPGDPRADIRETISCRCTIAALPKRDANGRLVRKPVPLEPQYNNVVQMVRPSVLRRIMNFLKTGS